LFFVFYGDGLRGVEDRVGLYWDGGPQPATIKRARM
jgi:hypothetical protein